MGLGDSPAGLHAGRQCPQDSDAVISTGAFSSARGGGRGLERSALPCPRSTDDRLRLFCPSALAVELVAGCGLRGCQTGSEHAEWRARNIVQSNLMTELHGRGLAAVFSANSD